MDSEERKELKIFNENKFYAGSKLTQFNIEEKLLNVWKKWNMMKRFEKFIKDSNIHISHANNFFDEGKDLRSI